MKNTVIIYQTHEGVAIVTPAPLFQGSLEDLARNAVPKGLKWRSVKADQIPSDRDFRDAWTDEFDTETVDVHMDKARDIHMQRIRSVRNQALEILDKETMKGLDVQAEKQVLRDIPQTFDLMQAKTPDELKVLWPSELKNQTT